MRHVCGTWADPFGHTALRKTERALVPEYRDLADHALARLTSVRLP
jgi:indolepyruvate ferredoxin oxidoreductase